MQPYPHEAVVTFQNRVLNLCIQHQQQLISYVVWTGGRHGPAWPARQVAPLQHWNCHCLPDLLGVCRSLKHPAQFTDIVYVASVSYAVVDARPVSSARAPTTSMHSEAGSRGEDKYAIVNFDGVHQLLQEQQWYTCSKSVVQVVLCVHLIPSSRILCIFTALRLYTLAMSPLF